MLCINTLNLGLFIMSFSFISAAWAADVASPIGLVPQPTAMDTLMQFAPLIFIVALMYFLLIRPQQKRFAEHQKLVNNLRRGDQIITGGGLYATIIKLEGEETLVVEIADNVRVKLKRSTITSVVTAVEAAANTNVPAKK
jgi:preprotein translocase subunit YajC